MALAPTVKALLTGCARILALNANDDASPIDLTPLRPEEGQPWPVIELRTYLATELLRQSDDALTVRPADPALFENHVPTALYLAVCSADTLPGTVYELTGQMTLALIAPRMNGLIYPATPNSPEAAEQYRRDSSRRET